MTEYEEDISAEITRRARCCLHYSAIDRVQHSDGTGCRRDVPIEKKAIASNGGSRFGIALRLPCDGAPSPLFRCPWFEATGIERARDEMLQMREAGARTLKRLAKALQQQGGMND